METEAKAIEYESPRIIDYGDFAETTLQDPMHPDPFDPHRDPHLNHSA